MSSFSSSHQLPSSSSQQCLYSAGGDFTCPTAKKSVIEKFFQPAWVDPAAKQNAQSERSAGGFPYAAKEWENRGKETPAWVGHEGFKSRR